MARKKTRNNDYVPPDDVKVADIITAAKSTMGNADYSHGYPHEPGTLSNVNFSGRRSDSRSGYRK